MDDLAYLTTFINHAYDISAKVICIVASADDTTGAELFCSHLSRRANVQMRGVESINLASYPAQDIATKLSLEILGGVNIFFLNGLSLKKPTEYEFYIHFLSLYQGPHQIVLLIPSAVSPLKLKKTSKIIWLPRIVEEQFFIGLIKLLNGTVDTSSETAFARQAVRPFFAKMNLTSAIQLSFYAPFISNLETTHEFITYMLPCLVEVDISLFELSGALFNKQAHIFFSLWHKIWDRYAPAFWPAYWSELFWRASVLVAASTQKREINRKALSSKLPYLFIKEYGMNKISVHELRNAHRSLCLIDKHIKMGGSIEHLDMFYAQFFSHAFRSLS